MLKMGKNQKSDLRSTNSDMSNYSHPIEAKKGINPILSILKMAILPFQRVHLLWKPLRAI